MDAVISNIRVLFPIFIFLWAVFLVSSYISPQRLRNTFFLMNAGAYTLFFVTGFFGEGMNVAFLAMFLLVCFILLLVPALLIINGVVMLKKEARVFAHMLSLILGVIIGVGEIAVVTVALGYTQISRIPKLTSWMTFIGGSVFYVSTLILAFVLYMLYIQIMPTRHNFKYVIIHGAGLAGGRKVTRILANRLDAAIKLYNRQAVKPILIPSGGRGSDEQVSEAQAMAEYLLENGIPETAIVIEDKSATTMENLRFSKNIIEMLGGDGRIALVTSNYHVYRCVVYANKLGMKVTGVAGRIAWYYWPSAVLREFVAIYTMKKHFIISVTGYVLFILLPFIFSICI